MKFKPFLLVMAQVLAGTLAMAPAGYAAAEKADAQAQISAFYERLTPGGRKKLGVELRELRPGGHEFAQAFLKPLAEGNGPLSRTDVETNTGRNLAGHKLRARQLMGNQVSLLGGYELQSLGNPIDWFRAPEGDLQWPTHLSRHYWLLPLAYVYRASGEPESADKVISVLLDWVEKFPNGVDTLQNRRGRTTQGAGRMTAEGFFHDYPDGPWTSLSAHARLDTWTRLFQLVWDAPAMTNAAVARLLNSLLGEHRQAMIDYPRAMNQYQGIASSLIGVGFYYQAFEGAAEAERIGWERLEHHTTREIYPDGSLAECSPNYGAGCVVRLHGLVIEGERRGRDVPPLLAERIRLAARYLAFFSDPLARSPRLAKGGGDVTAILRELNQAARDPEVEFVASRGKTGRQPGRLSYSYAWAGHHVLRSGWNERATWLFFDAGPRGSGHSDMAQLSVQLFANGEWLLTDPGYYTYSGEGEPGRMSRYLRSTAAHNTALVDGLEQISHVPGTSRGPNENPGEYHWHETAESVSAEGAYTYGYGEGGKTKVTHHRRVVFHPGENRFDIEDTFMGKGSHRIDLHWQLDPASRIEVAENRVGVGRERTRLEMRFESDQALAIQQFMGEKSPMLGWFSAAYGKLEPAPLVRVSTAGALPLRVTTQLRIVTGEQDGRTSSGK
jgi:hypothetical protein